MLAPQFANESLITFKNEPVQDPFRRGLGQAIQWYNVLRQRPEHMLEEAINKCVLTVAKSAQALSGTRAGASG